MAKGFLAVQVVEGNEEPATEPLEVPANIAEFGRNDLSGVWCAASVDGDDLSVLTHGGRRHVRNSPFMCTFLRDQSVGIFTSVAVRISWFEPFAVSLNSCPNSWVNSSQMASMAVPQDTL